MSGATFMVLAVAFISRVLSRRPPVWHRWGSAAVGRFLAWSAVGAACFSPTVWAASPQTFGTDPAYLINTFGTDDGMPENSATAMVQSADGYLWFGTFEGLVRFNGVEFTVFNPRNTPELPSAGIVNIHLDRSGRL
jgi:Two component regulator propeller